MDKSTSRCRERGPMQQHQITSSFKFLDVLGEGTFGKVLKCVERSTGKTVAIKIGKDRNNLCQEAHMLTALMNHNMDTFNIITFYGMCNLNSRVGLVFEMLDISLQDYLMDLKGPMRLEDIRTVMEQMAEAFDALKRIGIIHADVKIDNIMMVDHKRQPFRVKLIDFGLAVYRSQAKPYRVLQTPFYRSPEIMLGLPFSEAIDMWSLGCVMAVMLFGCILFPAMIDYQAFRQIIDLLGPPPDHLLNAGRRSTLFFKETDSKQWMLKTSVEYCGRPNNSEDIRFYTFRSLNQAKEMRLEKDNKTEAEDREESIELLKAMLTWDQKDRITPLGILNHPAVTKSYLQSSSHLSACDESQESRAATPSTGQAQIWINKTKEATLSDEDSTSYSLSHGVIAVQAAASENRIHLKDSAVLDSAMSDESQESRAATPSTSQAPTRTNEIKKATQGADDSTSYSLSHGVIAVQAAASENRIHLKDSAVLDSAMSDESQESRAATPSTSQAPTRTNEIKKATQGADDSTSYSLPRGVIMVQPAAPENRIHLQDSSDLENEMSDESQESMAATPSTSQAPTRPNEAKKATQGADDSTSYSLPRGVIMVQPAAPENRIHLQDSSDLENEMSCHPAEAPLTSIHSDATSIHSDATSIFSDVSTIHLEAPIIHSDATSIYSDATSIRSDATSIYSDATSIHSDATSIHSDNDDLSHTTSGKKKKKNGMKFFFSWMKRTFCSCCSVDDVQE